MLQSFAKGDTLTSYHASISGQSGKLKEMPLGSFGFLRILGTCNCKAAKPQAYTLLHTPTHDARTHNHTVTSIAWRCVAILFVVDCVRLRCVLRILGISVTHTHTHQKNTDTVLNCVGPTI